MSWSRLVFLFSWYQTLLFALGLCLVFHSRAQTTCSGRERERENHQCDALVWLVFHMLMVLDFTIYLGSLFCFPFSSSKNLQWERKRENQQGEREITTSVMSWSRLVIHIFMVSDFTVFLGSLFSFTFSGSNN